MHQLAAPEPYIRAWSQAYRNDGLVVIGVHTPEFSFEHEIDRVRHAIREREIDYQRKRASRAAIAFPARESRKLNERLGDFPIITRWRSCCRFFFKLTPRRQRGSERDHLTITSSRLPWDYERWVE